MHSLSDLPTLCYSRLGFLVSVSLHLIYVSQDLGSIHSALRKRPQDISSRSAEARWDTHASILHRNPPTCRTRTVSDQRIVPQVRSIYGACWVLLAANLSWNLGSMRELPFRQLPPNR